MPVLKRVPRWLNLDDDVRLLKPDEMSDAKNIKTISSAGRDAGALETAKGNSEVANTNLPAGDNKCIGAFTNKQTNNVYFFIWNSNSDHSIFQYNNIKDEIKLVLQSSVLNFSKSSYIQGVSQQGRDSNEVLLYFTDNINPPRKVNVQKALSGEYTSITNEIISVAKKPPATAPTWTYTVDSDYSYNNIYNKHFQFAARYLYDDGEYSSYSVISDLTFNDEQLLSSIKTVADSYNKYNNIRLRVPMGSEIVDKVEVIAREGNDGEWFTIKTIPNNPFFTNNEVFVDFKNDGAYPAADPQETNKYFNNVPLQAEAVTIVNNRLFFGNYVDGFDPSIDIQNASTGDITVKPHFSNLRTPDKDPAVSTTSQSANLTIIQTNYGGLSTLEVGDLYVYSIQIFLPARTVLGRTFEARELNIFEVEKVVAGDTLSSVLTRISDRVDGVSYDFGNSLTLVQSTVTNSNTIYTIFDFTSSSLDITNSSGKYQEVSAGGSFKKNSKYSLCIIHFDDYGRADTANIWSNNEVYIPSVSDIIRPKILGQKPVPATSDLRLKGSVSLDWRISNNIRPPEWAKYWTLGITENTVIDEFVQYSACAAYTAQNTILGTGNNIYLNLRSLTDFRDEFGTVINYNFVEGDRLRVLSYYDDSNGRRVFPKGNGLDFRITSAGIYTNEDDSPIFQANDKVRTTGFILGVENPEGTKFDRQSIDDGTDYWNSNGGNVVFEIYRPNKKTGDDQKVFFEIGGVKEIGSPGQDSRYYKGDVRDAGESVSLAVSSVDTTNNLIEISNTSVDLVVGDTVILENSGSQVDFGTITDVRVEDGVTKVFLNRPVPTGTVTHLVLDDEFTAGVLTGGDVWFRPRFIRNDNTKANPSYILYMVEDYNISDYYQSASWPKGRGNAFVENAKQLRHHSGVTYSDPYFTETNVNGFSSFNLSLGNFERYPEGNGAIHRLAAEDVYMMVFQENKLGKVPVNRRVIDSADGGTTLALSDDTLNEISYYKGTYGLTKAECYAEYDGDHFGWDIKRGKAWELNVNGLQLVSDYKVQSHFDDKSAEILPYFKNIRVIIGVDREYDEVLFSSPDGFLKTIEITEPGEDPSVDFELAEVTDDGTNLVVDAPLEKSPGAYTFTPDKDCRGMDEIWETGDQHGKGFVDLNKLSESYAIPYDDELQTEGTRSVTTKLTTTAGEEKFMESEYNFSTGALEIPKSQPAQVGITLSLPAENSSEYTGFTLSYNKKHNRWISFWDFKPEMYININYSLFAFEDGKMYKQYANNTRAHFFGTQYFPMFEVAFNDAPSAVKRFFAASIEGDSKDWAVVLTTNLNSGSLPKNLWEEKEGMFHAMLPSSSSGSASSSIMGLGEISGISGTEVTVTGLDSGSVGIAVGDDVYESEVLIGNIQSKEGDTITLNTVVGLSVGDFIYVKKDAVIDGDRLRGYYMTAKYTGDVTTAQEVFAVNVEASQSNLHHS